MKELWQRFRFLQHKRWRYLSVVNADFIFATALVDLNYSGLYFYYLFDRKQRKLLLDHTVIKRPWESLSVGDQALGDEGFSLFSARNKYWRFDGQRESAHFVLNDEIVVKAAWPLSHWKKASLLAEGPAFCAEGSDFIGRNQTFKTPAEIIEDGEILSQWGRLSLRGSLLTMDYSNGHLPYHTQWHWASAHSVGAGFNLQAGYFGDRENYFWLAGKKHHLGAALFECSSDHWRIHTPEDRLELRLDIQGSREHSKNFGLVWDQYEQPLGAYSGFLRTESGDRYPVSDFFGVAERHQARW